MGEPHSPRRKNIGFKPEGIDQAHDTAFSVLNSLPRGAVCDFIVIAVVEYLKNHVGETISRSRRRKYIILGDTAPATPGIKEPTNSDAALDLKNEENTNELSKQTNAHDINDESSVTEKTIASVQNGEFKEPETFSDTANPSYTQLDEDTLSNLVMGFFDDI